MKKLMFTLAFILPYLLHGLGASEEEIAGCYEALGYNPFSEEYYSAHLELRQCDDVYFATWTFTDESTDVGTGIRVDDILSICFQDAENPTLSGVQVYHIRCGQLYGPWAINGYDLVGEEVARKSWISPSPV